MGIFWCKEEVTPPEPKSPFRISNFGEDELVVHKLNYMKTVLLEQKERYLQNETREIAEAKRLKGVDVGEAKSHLLKAKLCRAMRNRLADRVFLVTRQIENIQRSREDLEFATTLESSNKLLMKLTKEVDSKQLSRAIEVIENAGDRAQELQELLARYQPEAGELGREFEALGEGRAEPPQPAPAVQSIEELERKELVFA